MMQAIILAGGKGTRLYPYTAVFPKPLVPLGDKPIMEIVIRQLKTAGFEDILISVGHMATLIQAYFGDGSKFGVKIEYVLEDTPMDTAGALRLIKKLDENFLVINGDVLTTLNYRKMLDFHMAHKATATVGVIRREEKIDYGVITTDQQGRLVGYIEKPKYDFLVSMGINILTKKAVSHIVWGESISMPELINRLVKNNERVYCFSDNCEWLDIGRPSDYDKAQNVGWYG